MQQQFDHQSQAHEQGQQMFDQDSSNIDQSGMKNQNRRKKEEMQFNFVCGDPGCNKKYGTNAALYTHIKNKHSGIQPTGTMRPSGHNKTGRIGRPVQMGFVINKFQLSDKFKRIGNIVEKKKIASIIGNPQFIELAYIIGMYGFIKNNNFITREIDELYEIAEEHYIQEINDDLVKIFNTNAQNSKMETLNEDQKLFIYQLSHYWKPKLKFELCFTIIYAILFGSMTASRLIQYIQINQQRFQTIQSLICERGPEQFLIFIDNLNKQFHLIRLKKRPFQFQTDQKSEFKSIQEDQIDSQEISSPNESQESLEIDKYQQNDNKEEFIQQQQQSPILQPQQQQQQQLQYKNNKITLNKF